MCDDINAYKRPIPPAADSIPAEFVVTNGRESRAFHDETAKCFPDFTPDLTTSVLKRKENLCVGLNKC